MATQRYRSVWVIALCCGVLLTALLMWGYSNPKASAAPRIDREKTILKGGKKQLVIVGENFEAGMFLQMESRLGVLAKGQINFVDQNTIIVENIDKGDIPDGVLELTIRNSNGLETKETLAVIPSAIGPSPLTVSDIQTIIGQGVAAAQRLGFAATFAVLDREGNILALYQMNGANKSVTVRDVGKEGDGLEGLGGLPPFAGQVKSEIACISKAGTGAFLSTFGNAFTTRTAAYIIRENIPPFIKNQVSGPLFGVQISSLGCSDVKQPGLPLGMSGDTGGVPIYRNGVPSGGLGVEINGFYNVALNRPEDLGRKLTDKDELYIREGVEEIVAFAAQRGFAPPDEITADKQIVNGIRLAYRRMFDIPQVNAVSPSELNRVGKFLPIPETGRREIRTGVPTEFRDIMLRDRQVRVVPRFFPFKNGMFLTKANVEQILFQGVREANRVRAAIRRPIDVPAEVNLTCVDFDGSILGIVSTPDAPIFGFDVSAEKGRASVLFSRPDTERLLRNAGVGVYADNLLKEGLRLNGEFAFADRSVGFIARPFYPDGISDRQSSGPGPLSKDPSVFSPLNNGFQTDYLLQGANRNPLFELTLKNGRKLDLSFVIGRSIVNVTLGRRPRAGDGTNFCDASNGRAFNILNNTVMIFPGSCPLGINGNFVGAIGISGDGVDQDDIIATYGTENFEVAPEKRIDRFFMRGIRIPYTKFPRHPHIGEGED